MRKLFFTSAFALFVTLSFSQTIFPKAGLTLSKWGGDDVEDAKFNTGFMLGFGANFGLGKGPISLQPELNYVQKGWKVEEGSASVKAKINYLEIPVLVRATFGPSITKFYVAAGPSLGFGLGGKLKGKDASGSEEVDIKFGDGEDDALYIEKKTDFGLQFGGGVIISEKVMIDIRYGAGMSSLFEDASAKNNVLQFTVGLPFNLN